MTFDFLPTPMYLALCVLLCGIMIYSAITRRNKDRRAAIAVYIMVAALTAIGFIMKIIKVYSPDNVVLYHYCIIAGIALYSLIFLFAIATAIIDYKKTGKVNNALMLGICLGALCLISNFLLNLL